MRPKRSSGIGEFEAAAITVRLDRSVNANPKEQVPHRIFLLSGVLRFTRAVRSLRGVSRVSLVGSLTTSEATPKDADVLVIVAPDCDLARLAKAGRALKGHAQTRNSGADIFLAGPDGRYIGRACGWRECRPDIRVACRTLHCGATEFLNDDLQVVNLAPTLIAQPPIDLWPQVVRRVAVPADVEQVLLEPLATA